MKPMQFRVWDHESRTIIPPSAALLGFVFLGQSPEPRAFLYDLKSVVWKRIPLAQIMESTFSHDRSGREIFEGDLLDTPRGRRLVQWRPATFDAIKRFALSQSSHPSDTATQIMLVGAFGPDLQQILRRLVHGRALAEAWKEYGSGTEGMGTSCAF